MIKKISAIVLALVLCLSVVVLPASAGFADDYTLPDGAKLAFRVELDKEYYSAGDTATVTVYIKAADDVELHTGAIAVGINSAIFNSTDNTNATLKASATASDLWNSFYKEANTLTWGYLASTNANAKKIIAANTAEENALYDAYVKVTVARNTGGSHDNAALNTNGLPGSEITADNELSVSFQLKVASTVTDGTAVNVGIPSGALTAATVQTYFRSFDDPGNATTYANIAAADTNIEQGTTAGAIGVPYPDFTIGAGNDAIRFEKNTDKSYANKVTIRTMAKIDAATLQAAVGATANDDVETYIKEAGFVFAPNSVSFDVATAKSVAEGATVSGYTKKNVSYIQNDGSHYNYTCLIEVQDGDVASASFNTYAFIALDFDKDGTADKYYYYDVTNAISAQTLYNTHNDAAWAKYGWGTATDK